MTKKQCKRRLGKLVSAFFRIGLKNRDFSLISNNCWGGKIYNRYGLPYLSPTVGCYFYTDEFLKFLGDLKHNLTLPLRMITYEGSRYKEDLIHKKQTEVPIGLINEDIEVVFLHYKDPEEAREKWERRCKRVNFDNLIVKMNDQNGFYEEALDIFLQTDFPHKLFLTGNEKYKDRENVVFLEKYKDDGYVVDDTRSRNLGIRTTKYLNSVITKKH